MKYHCENCNAEITKEEHEDNNDLCLDIDECFERANTN